MADPEQPVHDRVIPHASGDAVLDRLMEALYRRTRSRYVETLLLIQVAWILVVIVPIYAMLGFSFYGMTIDEYATLVVTCEVALVAATPGLFRIVRRRTEPLIRWLRGDPGAEPADAWICSVADLPRTIATGCMWCFIWIVPPTIYVGMLLELTIWGVLGWMVVQATFIASAGMFAFLLWDRALRPPRYEAVAALPPGAEPPEGGPSLRSKVLAILVMLSMFCAAFTAAVTTNSTNELSIEAQIWITIASALAFTFTLGFSLSLLVRESLLTRIEALGRAMDRVEHGAHDVRITPTGGDELDAVGRSFNAMVDRLGRHDQEMQESRARIVAASDAARRQVERDLHDGAQQHLVTLLLRLGMARRAVTTDPDGAIALLDEARDDLGRALDDLRDLAHGIYPAVLTTDGLPAALEVAGERCPLPVTIEDSTEGRRLRPDVEAAIYFCCVEALQNAAKHAGADARVRIDLTEGPAGFRFEIHDDGIGYDANAVGSSSGLQNMADRIGALGGTLRVESAPGAGTAVTGAIPGRTRVPDSTLSAGPDREPS